MTRTELIDKYALDVSVNTLERLHEITKIENIDTNWSLDKYISLDVINVDMWQINLWDQDESIIFSRVSGTNYFKALL